MKKVSVPGGADEVQALEGTVEFLKGSIAQTDASIVQVEQDIGVREARRADLAAKRYRLNVALEALQLVLSAEQPVKVLREARPADVGTGSEGAAPPPMAPARGRTIRSKNMTTEERADAVKFAEVGWGVREIARYFGRSASTISRLLTAEERRARAAQRGA